MCTSLAYASVFGSYTAWARSTPDWRLLTFLLVMAALLVGSLLVYLVSAIRNRGKPKPERKGPGLLGGFINMGRPGGGVSSGANPGAFALYGREDENQKGPGEQEDPRRR